MVARSRELVSARTRRAFQNLASQLVVRVIDEIWEDEGFQPARAVDMEASGVRRSLYQAYLDVVDWTDPAQVSRALRAFEETTKHFPANLGIRHDALDLLRKDGFQVEDRGTSVLISTGSISLQGHGLAALTDPSAIRDGLNRISGSIDSDPALAIGGAKDLIESTAKAVLHERGRPIDPKAKLPLLVSQAQEALLLHPSQTTVGPDGTDAVKRILGGAISLATGLGELRNRGYGVGHGPAQSPAGLRPRHARLAVSAATTWCQLMLDTLADETAPWRKPGASDSLSD